MHTTKDFKEPAHQVFDTAATDDQPIEEASQHPDWFQKQAKPLTPDRAWNKTLPASHGPIQPWISNLTRKDDSRTSFNELMDTPLDFSAFMMNQLKVDTLTPELLAGPTYELMKGSCKSLLKFKFFLEEGRRVIPFDHFINNDLEYLHGGVSSRMYTTSVTKTKAVDYGHIKWIEDLVPRTMWSQVESAQDVYSKRRIIAVTELQIDEWHNYKHLDWITVRKLTNLTVDERLAFNFSLRMFTRSIVIQRRVEDLQLGQQQSSSVSSRFVSNMLNPSPDTGIDSIFNLNNESTPRVDVPVTTTTELPLLSATTLPPPPTPIIPTLHQTPVPSPTNVPSSSLQDLPNFGYLFGFDHRLKALEINFSKFMRESQFAEAISSIPGIVDKYLDHQMNKAVKVAIIKEQVKEQVKAQVSKILPKIEKTVNEQLEAEVLTRSSNSSKTSHDVAANLSELELKKILIEKMESNKKDDSRTSLNELMDTPLDFSAFMMNRLKVDTLTPELLADWNNPEGQQYPHDLRKPLLLIPTSRGRRVKPFDHFINNDFEYLRGGVSSRMYTTSVTKTKAVDYGNIKWIEDLVPRTMWSQVSVSYDKHALWGISHWGCKRQQFYGFAVNRESARDVYSKRRIIVVTELQIVEWHSYKHMDWITVRKDDDKLYKFKEGDFKRLYIQDIEDMLVFLVQGKLTNLTVDECLAFNFSLRMFTRSIVIQRRVEDLQLGPKKASQESQNPSRLKLSLKPDIEHQRVPFEKHDKLIDPPRNANVIYVNGALTGIQQRNLKKITTHDKSGNIAPNGQRVLPNGNIISDRKAYLQANMTTYNTKSENCEIVGDRFEVIAICRIISEIVIETRPNLKYYGGAASEDVRAGQLNTRESPTWGSRSVDCFEKLEQIGEGTYGQVYMAREIRTGEIVALKKIRMDNEREGFPITAIREIKILKKLHHENVIKLKEIVTSPGPEKDDQGRPDGNKYKGGIYMVFEYMDHDLTGLADRPGMRFSVPQIKCYMRQLLTGLHYCHVNQVLHRDIKGSNLLIDNEGNLKLADFGLARSFSIDHNGNLTNRVITLWYRPPELLLGTTKYGPAVDMWSVGCIFAELLHGKPIFPGKDEAKQASKIWELCGAPDDNIWPGVTKLPWYNNLKPTRPLKRRLREVFRHFDRHALELLEKMLMLDPDKRISAKDALDAEYFWIDPLPCDPKR
uniref:Cyclin-dependent kinase C-2-like n=1 Tax=Tanacetum cinerariifolium TaxID=118510 RepID=A0A6L2LPP8_TANCI|nr:cyclin-dependent kinase C-2-like [Tanacetum cinerariifolium]